MDLISKAEVIKAIEDHKKRIGTESDLYQLAHDHIIRIVKAIEPPRVLKADNDTFIAGYEAIREDISSIIKIDVDKVISAHKNGVKGL